MTDTRAELHLHTKLSDDISIIGVDEIINCAKDFGLSAIAFTNMNNVQDIPKIAKHSKDSDLKIIYGAEVFYESENGYRGNKLTMLAKNDAGIKELYKVISSITDDGVCELIDLNVLKQNRKNLLIGSCGSDGEIFAEILAGKSEAQLRDIVALYDYLEIYPARNDAEKEINKKIAKIGQDAALPVIATSNAHYFSPDDAICRDIVRVARGFKSSEQNHLYLRTTQEMLSEFSYLGADVAQSVVVNNPQTIVALIEDTNPIKEEFFEIKYENAFEQIEKICTQKATQIYGDPLPKAILDRLQTELELINKNDFASQYLTAHKLVKHIVDNGNYAGVRGATGSSFVVFLAGISDINPLPAHYYCPNCHYFEESIAAKDSYDLPQKNCPKCNAPLKTDGHNIPYESFMGIYGNKTPDFYINVAPSIRLEQIKYLGELFGESKIAMAGTVMVLYDFIIQRYLNIYKARTGREISCEQEEKIIAKLNDVKKSEGVHPGGIMVIPDNMEFEDFTPVKTDEAPINATHFDFHDLHNTIQKVNILGVTSFGFLDALQKATGVTLDKIDINNPEIFEFFKTAETLGIPEFDIDFVLNLLVKTNPQTYDDLVKICGFAHGTNVWTNNGQHLIEQGISLSKIPTTREDIMNDLIGIGVERKTAFLFSDLVRRGMFVKGRVGADEVSDFEELCKPLGDWYFDFCTNIHYFFPKAHAIAYVTIAMWCAYFKKYYPKEFYVEYINNFFDDKDNLSQEELEKYNAIKNELNKYL